EVPWRAGDGPRGKEGPDVPCRGSTRNPLPRPPSSQRSRERDRPLPSLRPPPGRIHHVPPRGGREAVLSGPSQECDHRDPCVRRSIVSMKNTFRPVASSSKSL